MSYIATSICCKIRQLYLNVHSYHSLRYGTISEDDLIKLAVRHRIRAIALTDIHTTSACIRFSRLAERAGVHPVVGVDFRDHQGRTSYIALAATNEGFRQICAHLSQRLHTGNSFCPDAVFTDDVRLVYPLGAEPLRPLYDHEWIGVRPGAIAKLVCRRINQPDKLLAFATLSFRHERDYKLHRLLRAIDQNVLWSKLDTKRCARPDDLFYTPDQLRHIYRSCPEFLERSQHLLESCRVDFGWGLPKNIKYYTGSAAGDDRLLCQVCRDGLRYRYGTQVDKKVSRRLEKELKLIRSQNFVAYFLVSWDIVRYARSKAFDYVGRGSGANSLVAYLLRITDVDPVDLDLYFERFINLFRTSPPDFDIDFSWQDRDKMHRYIFERFDHVALLGTYNCFRYRASVREVAKVFGLPKSEQDRLCDQHRPAHPLSALQDRVLRYSRAILGFPSHLGVHAGGVLIGHRDIHHYTATFLSGKSLPVTQFDMRVAEDIGLHKFDILSQRGLSKIKEAIQIVKYNRQRELSVDIHNIHGYKDDPKIKKMLMQAQTIGCFYIESPAMRMLLTKLRVDNYRDLVAASSIIRPGVAKSGMMQAYIRRHRNPKHRCDASKILLRLMPETYGIMVYQEDVIKVAHHYAGLTLAESDMLRRGMSGKYRSKEEFLKLRRRFFDGCRRRGHPTDEIQEIWRQIESFAGYAFAKGHSASYAVESYQSLYLKAHYPLEYLVAVINNGGGFYDTWCYIQEAKRYGGVIHLPDINRSSYRTVLYGKDIYLGFSLIKDLEQHTVSAIARERAKAPFKNLDDFLARVPIPIEQLNILIRIDAFRFTGIPKRKLLWEAKLKSKNCKKDAARGQQSLFQIRQTNHPIPDLDCSPVEHAFDCIELLGFALISPFKLLRDPLPKHICARQMHQYTERQVRMIGYLVCVKNTKTSTQHLMQFGTFLDIEGRFIDTVHFPQSVSAFPFRGKGVYSLYGKITEAFDHHILEVQRMERLSYVCNADTPLPKLPKINSELKVKN